MRMPCFVTVLGLALIVVVSSAFAQNARPKAFEPLRTLYVSPRGDDKNDGLSQRKPFRTISAAAKAVKPGDLVLVSGGTYFEHVHLMTPGTAEHPIVFRAASGETALVTFGRRPTNWRKVKGTRFTYSVRYATIPNYVWEDRRVIRYVGVNDTTTLEEMPGSFLYDEKRQILSVHPLRGLSPEEAVIVAVDYAAPSGAGAAPGKRGYAYDKGFWPRAPYNRVEGFMIAYQPIGIQHRADNCKAWGNTAYGCLDGVTIYEGKDCVIANNTCYRNDGCGVHVSSAGINAVVRGNLCRHNRPAGPYIHSGSGGHPHNIALYGRVPNPTFIGNTVISDLRHRVWRYKSAAGKVVTTHNILVGGNGSVNLGDKALYANNTVVGGVFRIRVGDYAVVTPESAKRANSEARDNLYLRTTAEADKAGFADPVRHDYRLRKDSSYLGKGAFPEEAPLRYVSPQGNDDHDGQTPGTAWRTLAKAASSALPGETVYVMPGVYRETISISLKGTKEKPIAFKTHAQGRVVLEGGGRKECGILLKGASHVSLDGFIIKGFTRSAVRIEGGEGIELVRNIADGPETGIEVQGARNVTLVNNTLCKSRRALDAKEVEGSLILRNNLFADMTEARMPLDSATARCVISERNAFSGPKAKAQLNAWQKRVYEAHPSLAAKANLSAPDYFLPIVHRLNFAGLGHKPIGARSAQPDTSPIPIEDFRAARVSPNAAVVAWKTPWDYADARIYWVLPDGREKSLRVRQDEMFKQTTLTARLAGLKPATRCRVKVDVRSPGGRTGHAEMEFVTPTSVRAPTTLYVSPAGNDKNDGKNSNRPFRTLSAASFAACPGDTILVGPGVYHETLTLWCGGLSTKDRLVVRSVEPRKAVIDSGELRSTAIMVADVKHVTIDGFRLRGFVYSAIRKAVHIQNTEDLIFTNNVFEEIKGGHTGSLLFEARNSRHLVIRDNLFANGFQDLRTSGCDDVTVDHNTFYRAGINGVWLGGKKDAHWRVVNNIFVDVTSPGKSHPGVKIQEPSKNVVCDYNLYWRKNSPNMTIFGLGVPWRNHEDAKTIAEAQKMFGVERHGRFADPLLVNPVKGDFRLKPGSPAIGMGEKGETVGMRNPPAGM